MEPPSSIEIRVISCKNLSVFNFFQKLNAYAVVSIISDDPRVKLEDKEAQRQTTHPDRDVDGDGNNPEWNHEMRFHCNWVSSENMDNLFLDFEVRHDVLFSYKTIGKVCVPLTDLVRERIDGVVRFMSYEIRTAEGRSNGVLNFSYKVNSDRVGFSCSQQMQSAERIQYPIVEMEDSSLWSSSSSPAQMTSFLPSASISSSAQCQTGYHYHCYYSTPPPPPLPSAPPLPESSYGFRPALSMRNEVPYPPISPQAYYSQIPDPGYRPDYWSGV